MRHRKHTNPGFTLIELLVVIAMIAMLVSVMLPAIQATRSATRRAQCKSNLLQIVMAAQNYEMAQQNFPAGVTDPAAGPIRNTETGLHQSWTISLLPFLDEMALHNNVNRELSVYDSANEAVRNITIPSFRCPAGATSHDVPQSNYAACHHDLESPIDADNNGIFFLNSEITSDDVRDGLSHTIFFGEMLNSADELGWMSGTRATLRNTGTPINVDPWKSVVVFKYAKKEPAAIQRETDEQLTVDSNKLLDEQDEFGEEDLDGYEDEDSYGGYGDPYGDMGGGPDIAFDEDLTITEGPLATKTELSVGGFASRHSGGANVSFGDGRIQFMISAVDANVLQQLGHRNDGKLLDPADYRE